MALTMSRVVTRTQSTRRLGIRGSAGLFAVGYVAYSWYSARQARGRINHDAHLGGALFGLLFVLLTDPAAFGRVLRWLGA